jgi:hypothetical protein
LPLTNLSDKEKEYCKEVEELLTGVIRELEHNGWIRKKEDLIRDKESFAQMLVIVERVNTHLLLTNMLTEAFTSKAQATETCLTSLGVGFTKENVSTFWIYEVFAVFIESTEVLTKNLSLVVLPKKPFWLKMTFGDMIEALKKTCPTFGVKFASYVDLPLRNAITHGIYWMGRKNDGSINFYYSSELGKEPKVEPLVDILVRIRKHNLIGACLADVLEREIEADLFK